MAQFAFLPYGAGVVSLLDCVLMAIRTAGMECDLRFWGLFGVLLMAFVTKLHDRVFRLKLVVAGCTFGNGHPRMHLVLEGDGSYFGVKLDDILVLWNREFFR